MSSKDINSLIADADAQCDSPEESVKKDLYKKFKKAYESNDNNSEFLWRFSRAAYNVANLYIGIDEKMREKYIMEAKQYALDSYQLANESGDANKWCAITIGIACDYVGTKERIALGKSFKMHIDKALSILEPDATLFHLRARWCYNVSGLTWVERKIAQTLFGELPTSSYEEALESFLEAEKLKPNMWMENLLWLGKTYIALKQTSKAVEYLNIAATLPAVEPDEKAVQEEVLKLLAKHDK